MAGHLDFLGQEAPAQGLTVEPGQRTAPLCDDGALPRADSQLRVRSASVIICSWRRPAHLRRALAGVALQTRRPDEVLVCVRPDDEATRAVLAEVRDTSVREVLVAQAGLVAARNAGVDAARGDVLAYLDDDAVPHRDWLERLVHRYETDPTLGAVGGRDRVFHGDEVLTGRVSNVGTITAYGRWVTKNHLGYGAPRAVQLLKGANMSFRRQWLPELRWDSNLRGYGAEYHDDSALTLAIRRGGLRVVYDPAILVDHFEAPRSEFAPRENPRGPSVAHWAHNQTYASVRYLPVARAVTCVVYGLLIGAHPIPGLGMGVRRMLTGETASTVVAAVGQATRGRLAGIRTALRARREESRSKRLSA